MSVDYALKEWAAVTAAVGAGDQIVLVRKGGIDEKRFDPPAERFVLFPTQFHQGENHFRPDMAHHASAAMMEGAHGAPVLRWWCETVRVYRVGDLERLLELTPFVIFTEQTIRDRYQFRPRQAMHVLVVRAWALARPVTLEMTEAMGGCRSWIELPGLIDTDGSRAVLEDAEFNRQVAALDSLLSSEV